jgi:trans-aconitate 2-methyltransferase
MPGWSDSQYLLFADERTRAAAELLARVPVEAPDLVIDLGCGPGNSTRLLMRRWPGARVVGVDSAPRMLTRARADLPGARFVEADVADYRPDRPPSVVFANAVMQWVPGHEAVLLRMLGALAGGGALAVQAPRNFEEPSHRLMRELPGPWAGALAAVPPRPAVHPPQRYYDLLAGAGAAVDIWQTTYEHVMPDPAAIVEWVKGTGLQPYLDAVPEAMRPDYLAAYTEAIGRAYPPRADGARLFSFPRLFFVALAGSGR